MISPPVEGPQYATEQARGPASAVEPADGKSAIPEEIQPGSGQDGQAQAGLEQQPQRPAKRSRRAEKSRLRSTAYLELLDEAIRDATAGATCESTNGAPLEDSHVGLIFWTAGEKEKLFSALAVHGRDDLGAQVKAIGSKSEAEVRVYLILLESAVQDEASTRGRKKQFSRADVPAAHEVSHECDEVLQLSADALAARVEYDESVAEEQRYGEGWLIDADAAAKIEALLDGPPDSGEEDEERAPDIWDDFAQLGGSKTDLLTSATTFFDASMLLQLSRNLFMNGPPDSSCNFRTAELLEYHLPDRHARSNSEDDEESTKNIPVPEPAIYRSALDDLHFLVKNVTRTLVHATLFQATSRLRAKDHNSPAPMVLTNDVRVAVDLLGLWPDWKTYWAKLPRRMGLEVYSESDRYKRGRVGTKNGVKLTHDEVEAELRLVSNVQTDTRVSSDEAENAADLCDDTNIEMTDSEVSSDGMPELQAEHERRKRRRRLSPESFARAEERYMDTVDRQARRTEEARLREILGLQLPDATDDVAEEVQQRPRLKHRRTERSLDWREGSNYMAPWEVEAVRKVREKEDGVLNFEEEMGQTEMSDATVSPRDSEDETGKSSSHRKTRPDGRSSSLADRTDDGE